MRDLLPPATLDYASEPGRPGRWRKLLLYLMTLYPMLVAGGLYAIWLCEYIVNGEEPIPPHHGASGLLEEVIYFAGEGTCAGTILALPLTVVGCFTMLAVDGDELSWWKRWRWLLPLVVWGLVFLLFRWDPHGVMEFILD